MRKLLLATVIGLTSLFISSITLAAKGDKGVEHSSKPSSQSIANANAQHSVDRDKGLERAAERRHTRRLNKKAHKKFKKIAPPVPATTASSGLPVPPKP